MSTRNDLKMIHTLNDAMIILAHFHDPDPSIPLAAKARLDAMEPTQAVLASYQEGPTSQFLLQLCLVAADDRYRRSGTATMLIHHIVSGQSNTGDSKTHWEIPVLGLTRILSTVALEANQGGEEEDVKILLEILSSYSMIVQSISKDLSFLQDDGHIADTRRQLLSSMLYLFMIHPEQRMRMFEQASIRLVLTCWLYTVPSEEIRSSYTSQLTSGLISNLFKFSVDDEQGHSPLNNYLEIAFQAFDIGTFVSRLAFIMQSVALEVIHPHVVSMAVEAITVFLHHKSYLAHIVGARIHAQLLQSVKSLLINSARDAVTCEIQNEDVPFEGGPIKDFNRLLDCSGNFIQILIDRSARTEGGNLLLDLIRNTPMMEVCAAALQLLNRTDCMPKASDSSWILVLTMITALVDFRECSIAAGRLILRPQHYAYIQEVSEAVKTIIGNIASPVLHSLRSEAPGTPCPDAPHSDYANFWKGLLDRVGIAEESIHGSYIEQKCCNVKCPYRIFETCLLMAKKSRCAGCHTAFYCGRECQIMDWKNHKKECKKMRKASAQ